MWVGLSLRDKKAAQLHALLCLNFITKAQWQISDFKSSDVIGHWPHAHLSLMHWLNTSLSTTGVGIYSSDIYSILKNENTNWKSYLHPNVLSSTIYNSQDMEAIQKSINRCTDYVDVVFTYNGALFHHKNEWNFAICNNMGRKWK